MNILIIDDETNIRYTLSQILEDEGYNVKTAEDGSKGLRLIAEFTPDVVLLDVKMEGLDGLQVLQKALQINAGLQVIMISGHSGIREAVKAIKLGAFDFLEKPLTLHKVKITVNKAIQYGKLAADLKRYKTSLDEKYRIIGNSKPIIDLKTVIKKVAVTNAKVLIRGESGTGKELIAYNVHALSKRAGNAFVKFNSAAIPTELVESELFGFEKGAFTGAAQTKKGKIEEADGGSLFLDEIGDMSLSAQAKILRVIQEGEFERVGSNKTHKVNARIIAATHKNLEELIGKGEFREDLFYRLNVVPIQSPPLREHLEDIPELLEYFTRLFAAELNVKPKIFTANAIKTLMNKTYPGNIREFRNIIERIFILCDSNQVTPEDLMGFNESRSLDFDKDVFWNDTQNFNIKKTQFETLYLSAQLKKYENSITKTAKALNMHQSNLSRKLKELKIK